MPRRHFRLQGCGDYIFAWCYLEAPSMKLAMLVLSFARSSSLADTSYDLHRNIEDEYFSTAFPEGPDAPWCISWPRKVWPDRISHFRLRFAVRIRELAWIKSPSTLGEPGKPKLSPLRCFQDCCRFRPSRCGRPCPVRTSGLREHKC
jgi:hypothetical protein